MCPKGTPSVLCLPSLALKFNLAGGGLLLKKSKTIHTDRHFFKIKCCFSFHSGVLRVWTTRLSGRETAHDNILVLKAVPKKKKKGGVNVLLVMMSGVIDKGLGKTSL